MCKTIFNVPISAVNYPEIMCFSSFRISYLIYCRPFLIDSFESVFKGAHICQFCIRAENYFPEIALGDGPKNSRIRVNLIRLGLSLIETQDFWLTNSELYTSRLAFPVVTTLVQFETSFEFFRKNCCRWLTGSFL